VVARHDPLFRYNPPVTTMDIFTITLTDGSICRRLPVIFGIGLNYGTDARQIGLTLPEFPFVSMKQGRSAVPDGAAIELPCGLPTEEVDYEGELAAARIRPHSSWRGTLWNLRLRVSNG
jgi:hypothetical protein